MPILPEREPKMHDTLAAALLPFVLGLAQVTTQEPPREGPPHPKSPILEALDLNHDGILSGDEIARASQSLLKLDKNGDGQLTPDEYRPPRPDGQAQAAPPRGAKGTGPRPTTPKRLERPRPLLDTTLDTDGDEVISAKEMTEAPALLRKLDRNGDGRLTRDEYDPQTSQQPVPPTRE